MSRHKAFAIKHKQTGKLFPAQNLRRTAGGVTSWDPTEINNKRKSPRLFETANDAQLSADRWEKVNGSNQLVVIPVTVIEDLLEW
jgi:hypothetical protein